MHVLVTGGAGFIGSHVAAALLARGDSVTVLDDLSNGLRENVPPGASLVVGDVRRPDDIEAAIACGPRRPDGICHLAGQASTFKSFEAPSWDMEVNGVGTARMIEAARRHRVRVFVHASSMTAYGPPDALPVHEEMASRPISFYGATKWVSERAVLIAASEAPDPFRAVCFRMFNVYGPRQSLVNPYQGVMGIFLGRVLRGEEILVFGDGLQSRDFVYAQDVAAAWLAALDRAPAGGTVLNLGTGTEIDMNTLWRLIVRRCGHDPAAWPHRHEAARPGDQRRMVAAIGRAREILGWRPQVGLDTGLDETIAWARSALSP
jgi:UDP-glucose 4-epimerase